MASVIYFGSKNIKQFRKLRASLMENLIIYVFFYAWVKTWNFLRLKYSYKLFKKIEKFLQ